MTTVKVVPLCRWCPVINGAEWADVTARAKSETQAQKLIGRQLAWCELYDGLRLWEQQGQPVKNLGEVKR